MLRIALAAALAAIAAACAPLPVVAAPGSNPVGETAAEAGPSTPGIGARGGMCGGIAGFQCEDAKDYCAMEAKVCVEIADAAGVCAEKPTVCTMDYRPVCGCDGKTYGNACAAAGAGVSIAAEGECPTTE